jgi:hypothetical protein
VRRLVALVLLAGCGLADPDVSTLRFELTPVKYGIDTRFLHVPPGFWRLRCDPAAPVDVCCQFVDCTTVPLVCRDTACVNDFHFEAYGTIDMAMQAPAFTRVKAGRVADLTLSRIRYDIENTLNIDLPAFDLFLAPVAVTSADDPQAQRFGIMPPMKAKTTAKGREVEILPGAREIFAPYVQEWGAFNLIVIAPVVVSSTMMPLTGAASLDVVIEVSGSLKL